MAGEIEEPFRLDFEVDSVHSGSISFGRFENEALCWERRSSFSHNRYLEEVEKCSKPGSVIEKKAYFEAHFRKKGLLGLNSPGCKSTADFDPGKDDDVLEKMNGNDEGIAYANDDETHCASFEDADVFSTSFSEPLELGSKSSDSDCTSEHVKCVDAVDGVEIGSSVTLNSESGVKMSGDLDRESGNRDGSSVTLNSESGVKMSGDLDRESGNRDELRVPQMVIQNLSIDHKIGEKSNPSPNDIQDSSPKMQERTPPFADSPKQSLIPQDRVEQRRRNPTRNASKVAEKKVNQTAVPRSKSEKTSPASKRSPMNEASKYKLGSKPKCPEVFNRVEKQSTGRSFMGPRPSTTEKISSRGHHGGNRFNPVASGNKMSVRLDSSRFSFKSDERAQRRKEFDMKLEEKMNAREAKIHQIKTSTQEKKDAEIKQLRKSLNFKAIPMPSFYRRASLDPHELYKSGTAAAAAGGNNQPEKQGCKSWTPRSRVAGKPTSDQPQASVTSCHSTVTSDSSATSRGMSKTMEAEKVAVGSRRIKAPPQDRQHLQMYKGKTFNGKQRS
ncbi:protein WVD2-like 7 [Andrographis paniculata]|uniref:protein WVD2-like 7 n=1 Tax=Andrographis paniculata TaxID=175694 RepID=UPI0021E9A8BC|nr:protein WVD2-like 7 [Andrographis paniculata]